jgi:hypothetical protein
MQHCYEHWWLEFRFTDEVGCMVLLASEETAGCFFTQLDLNNRGSGM